MGLNEHCQSCLCEIRPGKLPLCEGCYDELLALPQEVRMARIAELRKNEMLGDLVDNLIELIEMSKRYTPYRMN